MSRIQKTTPMNWDGFFYINLYLKKERSVVAVHSSSRQVDAGQ